MTPNFSSITGIVLIEILTRDEPVSICCIILILMVDVQYPNLPPLTVVVQVASGKFVHPIPEHTEPQLKALISKCFSFNPEKRPSFEQIYKTVENIEF
jgi:serine/threonine protein kinase